jgi:hypothetical protein
MREELRTAGKHVPRSNKDVEVAYSALNVKPEVDTEEIPEVVETVEADEFEDTWTYIGAGHEPPSVIKFMGKESFTRGVAKKVQDYSVLTYLNDNNNRCFVKGRVDPDVITEMDEKAEMAYRKQLASDKELQANMKAFR